VLGCVRCRIHFYDFDLELGVVAEVDEVAGIRVVGVEGVARSGEGKSERFGLPDFGFCESVELWSV
jgi:hypothetical protein